MQENFSVVNKTKGKLPSLPFVTIKNDILGKKYNLSLVFIGPTRSRAFNKQYRNKNIPTNILSFPYSKKDGEILITPSVVKKQFKKFNRNYNQMIGFLVIHGCLHLKGMEHSSTMEKAEKKYDQKYFGWH